MRPPSVSKNATALRDLDYEVVKLSYIQTDRALAILKTMGYTVVEYKAGKGEISGENNFTQSTPIELIILMLLVFCPLLSKFQIRKRFR